MNRHAMLRAALPALALVLCATAAGAQLTDDLRRLAETRNEPGPPRRGCGLHREPRTLPAVATLADSGALAAALTEFAEQFPMSGDSAPYALYSITVAPSGQPQAPRPLAYLLPSGQVGRFHHLVQEGLRTQGLRPGTVRLRVRLPGTPTFAVEHAQRCPAEVRTRFSLNSGSLSFGGQRPQPARVRVIVADDGRILGVQQLSSTGNDALDRWLQDSLRNMRAVPGLIDGVPTQMEVDETIQINTR